MDLTSAAVLLWISAAVFFTVIVLGSITLLTSLFFKCKRKTRKTTHIDLEEVVSIEASAGKTVCPQEAVL